MGTRRRLRVESDLGRVADLRALVRDAAADSGAPEVCVDDIVQAVDETATNVIVHGYAGRPGWLDMQVDQQDERIVITLEDGAPPFDPTMAPEPDLSIPADHRKPGGMGIHLLRLAVDTVTHRPRPGGGNILTMTRTFDPRPVEDR